jgi:hypothetical protein
MPEYLSGRKRNLNLGISSYTENDLVLDVIGNTNISGVTTLGTVKVSSGIITSSNPGVSTIVYYGDGSNLLGVKAFSVINQDLTSSLVYPTFANNTGVSSVGISTQQFVFAPSTGSVGIGTTNPTSKLTVIGDVLVSGIVTATTFVGNLTGTATTATTSGYATTAGIATYATYATSSGIATYATTAGIATYATTSGVSTSVVGGIGSITQLQVTGISTFTNGPVFIGAATSTGTASQPLQVTGGAYVSGSVGIGTTNPTSKLDINAGTATTVTNSSALNITQTWNNSASTFTGIKYNVTNTASASGSLLLDLQLGGSSVFNVSSTGSRLLDVKSGTFYVSSLGTLNSSSTAYVGGVTGYVSMGPTAAYQVGGVNCGYDTFVLSAGGAARFGMDVFSNGAFLCSGGALSFSNSAYGNGIDLTLNRDAANTLAQRRSTAAQTFRVYNTYTSGTNYELGKLEWSSNVFRVGTEKGSAGGTARELHLQTDGTTRVAISTTGLVGIGTVIPTSTLHVVGDVLVTGISTFTNGPVFIGAATSTGTASQRLQVTGGAYVSGNIGAAVTAPSFAVDVSGDARVQSTGKMRFGGTAGTTNFYIQYNSTTNSLDFVAG